MAAPDVQQLLARLAAGRDERLLHVERVPARAGTAVGWPDWVDAGLRDALTRHGIALPWTHQAEAAELAHAGHHVVVSTGTASGKSLAYLMPALTAVLEGSRAPNGRGATVLYLAPTKALAHDQWRAVEELGLDGLRASAYDGDTPDEERAWIRAHAAYVLTNPDLVHRSLLPGHERWASFLRALRYVVVDECHVYRGVFGSHVANVLRRLRRVAARYGSDPVFVLASATSGDPAGSASRLVGLPVQAVSEDASPRGATSFALWEPPLRDHGGENDAPTRRTATAETASLLTDLVVEGVRTLAFVRSRRGAEAVARTARDQLAEVDPDLVGRVAAYRAGYLPEERRALEAALRAGELLGVAATNALELGVDVTGLDAVLLCGWPGTRASLRQQAGRAGRSGGDALAVLVARDDPLDTYLVHHPEAVFGAGVEATVCDPTNPYILGPHLCAAAAELPLTEDDLPRSGRPPVRSSTRSSSAACCGPVLAGGSGPVVSGRPTSPTCAASAAAPFRWWRTGPVGCWAPSTPAPPIRRCTRGPSTCTRGRRTSSTTSTSTMPSPWRTARTSTGRRRPATRPTSVSSTRSPASHGVTPFSCTGTSRSRTRSWRISNGAT